MSDCVTNFRVTNGLNGSTDKPNFSCTQFGSFFSERGENTKLSHLILKTSRHEPDDFSNFNSAIDHSNEDHNSQIGIKPRIKDESSQGNIRLSSWRRNFLDDLLQKFLDPDIVFGADSSRVLSVEPNHFFNLRNDPFWFSSGQINFVKDGNNF